MISSRREGRQGMAHQGSHEYSADYHRLRPVASGCRFCNSQRIVGICLVSLPEGCNSLGRNDLGRMAMLMSNARPVMGRCTGFEGN